jgi:hypothetical protein
MRTRRTRRIGLTQADHLVAGNPPGSGHQGLGVLLDAATAPPSVEELAGETAAVARFAAAYRVPAAELPMRNRVRVSRSARMVAVKVAAGVAVLAAGGTAVAAETGSLPAGVQQLFSVLGVPASDGGPQPTASGAGPSRSGGPASPSPTPVPSGGGAITRPAETTVLGLCQAWDDARTDPHGKAMPAAARHALATVAGGEKEIAGFCTDVLATSATATSTQPSTGSSPGSGPSPTTGNSGGNGNGNGGSGTGGNGDGDNGGGNGNGDGNGSGNGKANGNGSPTPTPTATNPQDS